MSRVHDAMRRAGQMPEGEIPVVDPVPVSNGKVRNGAALAEGPAMTLNLPSLMSKFEEHPFNPPPESHPIHLHPPLATPTQYFPTLPPQLTSMQTLPSL